MGTLPFGTGGPVGGTENSLLSPSSYPCPAPMWMPGWAQGPASKLCLGPVHGQERL